MSFSSGSAIAVPIIKSATSKTSACTFCHQGPYVSMQISLKGRGQCDDDAKMQLFADHLLWAVKQVKEQPEEIRLLQVHGNDRLSHLAARPWQTQCAGHKAKGNPALPLLPHTKKHISTWDTAAKRAIIQCDINYIYFQTWHSFRKSKLADARFADEEKQECFDILNDCRQWCAPRSAFSPRFRNILSALLRLSAWPTASPPQITFKVIVLFNISLTSASKIVATVTPEIIIFYHSLFWDVLAPSSLWLQPFLWRIVLHKSAGGILNQPHHRECVFVCGMCDWLLRRVNAQNQANSAATWQLLKM